MAQWDGKDLAACLSSALVTQVSVDIVIDSIPLSQNYSGGGFCFSDLCGGGGREKQSCFSQRDVFDYALYSI